VGVMDVDVDELVEFVLSKSSDSNSILGPSFFDEFSSINSNESNLDSIFSSFFNIILFFNFGMYFNVSNSIDPTIFPVSFGVPPDAFFYFKIYLEQCFLKNNCYPKLHSYFSYQRTLSNSFLKLFVVYHFLVSFFFKIN
jgi:hypothetical protein